MLSQRHNGQKNNVVIAKAGLLWQQSRRQMVKTISLPFESQTVFLGHIHHARARESTMVEGQAKSWIFEVGRGYFKPNIYFNDWKMPVNQLAVN